MQSSIDDYCKESRNNIQHYYMGDIRGKNKGEMSLLNYFTLNKHGTHFSCLTFVL